MRATSSFLTNYSNPYKRDKDARCGLPIGYHPDGADDPANPGNKVAGTTDGCGGGSYIVGGWCIGTILDSGASRAAVSNQVRTAPCSMAMSVNVNVQWWTRRLFSHYMDIPSGINTDAGTRPRAGRLGAPAQRRGAERRRGGPGRRAAEVPYGEPLPWGIYSDDSRFDVRAPALSRTMRPRSTGRRSAANAGTKTLNHTDAKRGHVGRARPADGAVGYADGAGYYAMPAGGLRGCARWAAAS